ncbi:MAG: hypothetical protein PGN24_08115 [Microbacterium arborescens]
MSLRAAMGLPERPDFVLALPTGWVRRGVDEATLDALRSQARGRLLQAHRPDLYARLQPMLGQAFAAMASADVIALFAPGETDDALVLPASMIASTRTASAENLDPLVGALIREGGATPLLGDKRFLRFEREVRRSADGQDYLATEIGYLTPIPGTRRRQALQLTVSILRPVDAPADDEPLVLMKTLFDLSVSSLRWEAPAA